MCPPTPDRRQFLAGAAAITLAMPPVAAKAQATTARIDSGGRTRLGDLRALVARPNGSDALPAGRVSVSESDGAHILTLDPDGRVAVPRDRLLVLGCGTWPGVAEGVQLWRYEPWRAWTKPMAVGKPADMQEREVQFLYWREPDGSFGAAVPLSGAGFRTTLGSFGHGFAAKGEALVDHHLDAPLPMLALAFGDDPHATIATAYRAAFKAMGRPELAASAKVLPAPLAYLGWNTWNASNLGKDLTEGLVLGAVRTLKANKVPIGWVVMDDGYFDHRDQRLRSFRPDPARFPRGFAPLVAELKRDYGIRHVGAWLALDGYWHGIDPDSPLGRDYAGRLFTWSERRDRADEQSPVRSNAFVRPDGPEMDRYYDAHLSALKAQAIDFVKVDNQLVVERMAAGNFPVWTLGTAMHRGLNAAVARNFDNAVINCMDMTAEAYFNFGTTPVARAVEDYFPYKADETYELGKGNAAAHVVQALYNALYFGQFCLPDFDMFESTNPNARLHAVARAANNGPIYITDQPGRHDIALLRALALEDGRILRAQTPLVPIPGSLFQLQRAVPFKAFSRVGDAALLAMFNLADTDRVIGHFTGADVPGFGDRPLVAYDHLKRRVRRLDVDAAEPISLARFEPALWSLHDADRAIICFGRSDKINGLAAVEASSYDGGDASFDLLEVGPVAGYCRTRPRMVTIDRRSVPYSWSSGLLDIDVPIAPRPARLAIKL